MKVLEGLVFLVKYLVLVESLRIRRLPVLRQCETPLLKNGQVRLRQRGKLIRYQCHLSYELIGERYSACVMSRWENPVPMCIKRGCPDLERPSNGQLMSQNGGASTYIFCYAGYELAGSDMALCDGMKWDRALGSCRNTHIGAETSCDFETQKLCGWKSDPTHEFDWKRRNGVATTKQLKTGPKHDHTTMEALSGHYMVAQSADQYVSSAARLISPIYEKAQSVNMCFRFYYHMYGMLVGRLRVYVKPITVPMNAILPGDQYVLFERTGTDQNMWKEVLTKMIPTNESFQIVFEAISGHTELTDIAIDDVALIDSSECADDRDQTTMTPTEEVGGVFDIQSCANRCQEERQSTGGSEEETILNGPGHGGVLLHCDCFDGCEDQNSCCPDYRSLCVFAATTDVDEIYSTVETSSKTTSSIITNQPAIIATESVEKVVVTTSTQLTPSIMQKSTPPVLSSTSKTAPTVLYTTTPTTTIKATTKTTPTPTPKTTSKIPLQPTTFPTTQSTITTPKPTKPTIPTAKTTVKIMNTTYTTVKPTTIKVTTQSTPKPTTTQSTPKPKPTTSLERIPLVTDTTESLISDRAVVPAFGYKNSSKYIAAGSVNEWNATDETSDTDSLSSNLLLIITALCLLVLSVPLSYVLYRKYRRFNGDYKIDSRAGRQQRCSEFSEVRFLTDGNDELVDF